MPETTGWWRELTLPEGVQWYRTPTVVRATGTLNFTDASATQNPAYTTMLAELRAWAGENGLRLTIANVRENYVDSFGGYSRRPYKFYAQQADAPEIDTSYAWADDFECPFCGEEHLAYTQVCGSQGIACADCHVCPDWGDRTFSMQDGRFVCSSCYHACEDEECEVQCGRNTRYCATHGVSATCDHCGEFMQAHINEESPWNSAANFDVLCGDCYASVCPNCDRHYNSEFTFSSEMDAYVCRRCFMALAYGGNEEELDRDVTMASRALRIPTIPGRESIRTCGVEIEGATGTGNGNDLAQALYNNNLSAVDGVMGYHHGPGEESFAHVERDSSVDWEVVMGPFNPADVADVGMLNETVRTVREMVHDGVLALDLRAGLHIHVEAARVSLDGAFNLNSLFAYLEDVIFRLGAARWPIHRAIANEHYTQPIPKGLRKLQFARHHHSSDDSRYYALSFANYFDRIFNNCGCGAVRYDSWEECTCDLGKCTFEFRVFNTTANPRKLHAYLALTQALVAKAMTMGRIDNPAETFPALSFAAKRFKDMSDTEQTLLVEEWQARLTWLFSELPLTDDEKESLIYCLRYSELESVGGEFIDTLLPQEVAEEVTA